MYFCLPIADCQQYPTGKECRSGVLPGNAPNPLDIRDVICIRRRLPIANSIRPAALPVGCVVGANPHSLDIRDVICIRRCRLQIANSILPAPRL